MSGIAGIFNLDGRPVDPQLLARMTNVIAQRGPDGGGCWIDGPVGLGHRMLHTTPESLHERQPLTDESGQLCLSLDGRVDNREELRAALLGKGSRLRDDTDAELVLRAYECWGTESPRYIIGDFAFVIWDGRERQLFCARDIVGIKPFYYYFDGQKFIFGSEIAQLFEDREIPREPNEGMISEYLACSPTSNEETLFRNVYRLQGAHYLLIKPELQRKARYWRADPVKEIHYRKDDQYAESFLELFKETLCCCLRSHKPVGIELSGGLDSSSVVCLAHAMSGKGELPGYNAEAFSLVFPGLECDESGYINSVVEKWNVKATKLPPDHLKLDWYKNEIEHFNDFPQYPNGVMNYSIRQCARKKGIKVLLTGHGPDMWLTGSYYHYADYISKLKLLTLLRQMYHDREMKRMRMPSIIFPSQSFIRLGIIPLLSTRYHNGLKRLLRRKSQSPAWMDERFCSRSQLFDRLRQKEKKTQFPSYAQQAIADELVSGWMAHGNDLASRTEAWFNIEDRHPLMDRRIIEFALAIPEEQRWQRKQTKYVLRQAMTGILPEVIRQRLTKADFGVVFVETLQALIGVDFFDSLETAKIGWVKGTYVKEMYHQMLQAYNHKEDLYPPFLWNLWMILGIELWFKTVFLNRSNLKLEDNTHDIGIAAEVA